MAINRKLKLLVGGAAAVLLLVVVWCFTAYRTTSDAKAAMISDVRVTVAFDESGVFRFSPPPTSKPAPVGLVFFPGGMVSAEAYAPLARAVAAAGYPVILVPLPRRGMFGAAWVPDVLHRALGAMHEDERAVRWVLGGHSVGAALAVRMAVDLNGSGARTVAGVLLMGTTEPRSDAMAKYPFPITKIVATNDGLAKYAEAEANRAFLPASAHWVRIEGGNHSQFGWYGFQPLDQFAAISRDAQHEQMINATLEALRRSSELSDVPQR